jgi:hypothetical protein
LTVSKALNLELRIQQPRSMSIVVTSIDNTMYPSLPPPESAAAAAAAAAAGEGEEEDTVPKSTVAGS